MQETPDTPADNSPIVFDTTVLSNFAAAGELRLLERLYGDRGRTTLMVASEIEDGLAAGYQYLAAVIDSLSSLSPEGWLSILTGYIRSPIAVYRVVSDAGRR